MEPVPLQSLSELERASLQELALFRLRERLPGGQLSLDRVFGCGAVQYPTSALAGFWFLGSPCRGMEGGPAELIPSSGGGIHHKLLSPGMQGPAQLETLQLLLFLLPPCHSDTLLRLLRFLAQVAQHAESSWDAQGRQIPGNKMTVSNLATVFGPNILQKEKPGEKDAGALNFEDSAAIIVVLQRLIEHHHSLFMVSPEMQCDVLRRLFQTDPDVIEYLLRRKFPDVLSPEREDGGEEQAPAALPGWTHSLQRGSVSSELFSNISFLNLDVGI
ncbi:hypothetical protein Nmel_013301 [Mimus melanotis]